MMRVFHLNVRESKIVSDSRFHAIDTRFHALNSSLCWWDLDSGLQSLVRFQIPKSMILDSTGKIFRDSGFHGQNFSDSGIHEQSFSDSGIHEQKFSDSEFHEQNFSDPGIQKENFSDSGFQEQTSRIPDSRSKTSRILESGFPYMGRSVPAVTPKDCGQRN